MTPEELRLDEALRWLAQAGRDLNAAKILVFAEPSRSAFHSQQAAEKAAKAFLAYHNVPFRKTHDLEELGKQCVALNPSLTSVFPKAENTGKDEIALAPKARRPIARILVVEAQSSVPRWPIRAGNR